MPKPDKLFKQIRHPKSVNDYYHIFNSSNAMNVVYWWEFFKQVQGINGDIVECGVGRARSLITLSAINKLTSALEGCDERRIFALDSFQGFPEPTFNDKSARNPKKGEWSRSPNNQFSYTPKAIEKILKNAGIDSEITYLKGFFDKITSNFQSDAIAILHLDGDLYGSVLHPLKNLWKKLVIGGIIVIDDFLFDKQDDEPFPGARKAVMEFLEDNNCFDYLESIRGTPYLKRLK
tara:strand:+ start:527 stop:1228 length:702 start_codon:yes stop_codon:yes gene_type:complete